MTAPDPTPDTTEPAPPGSPVSPSASAATVPVAPESMILRARPNHVRLDPPIQHKIGLMVVMACLGGFALGGYAERNDGVFWRLVVLVAIGLGVLRWVTSWWITSPICKLASQAERAAKTGLTSALKALPVGRSDEVGRIAKALHSLGVASTRGYLEAQLLRRDMDHQIEAATKRATNELSRLVMRDALTDLGNRRFLDMNKVELFEKASQSDQDLACVMIDLDHFKQVNDTLGHEAGDHLLVFLAGLIRAVSRSEDMPIRLGGDELMILMPNTDAKQATEIVGMINKNFIRQAHTMFPDIKMLGLSFGVSSLKADGCPDVRMMMGLADKRLYASKNVDR